MSSLFVGILYNESDIGWLLRIGKTSLQVAANTYQWNVIKGIEESIGSEVDILSFLPLGSFPNNSKALFVNTQKSKNGGNGIFLQLGYVNLKFVKELCRFSLLFVTLRRWIIKAPQNSSIFVYSMYAPFLWALEVTKKLRFKKGINYCLIVPDLVGRYGISPPWYTLRGMLYRIDSYFLLRLSRHADYYVFLTKAMSEVINIYAKPYTIIEGTVSNSQIEQYDRISNEVKVDTNSRIILYSGSLLNEFGIENLLKAFLTISNPNIKLWFCGPSTESQTVLKYASIDSRIKYLGFLQREELIKLQLSATVLVNPRTDEGEYVKYSFPSKTMEYLLSGRPLIMFKLPGIPPEYYDYLYFFPEISEESIAKTLVEVCSRSMKILDNFGHRAKMFVIKNKNSVVQAKKIVDLINSKAGIKGEPSTNFSED